MNINEEIQKATDKFIEEKLPQVVYDKAAKMVDEIMTDIFRSYSDTAKAIKTKIEEKLDINLQKFDLVDYNAIVSKAINDNLIGIVNETAIAPILQLTKEATGLLKIKTIKLSEIHQLVIEAAKDEHYEDGGTISFFVEEAENEKWHTVSFDLEKKKSSKDCAISFLVSKSTDGGIFCFQAGNYWYKKGDVTPARLTMLSRLEHQIFRLYSAQVSVIIDEQDFYNEWSRYDD